MRAIVFFDLPTLTAEDIREYNRFHKFLIKNGYLMMQNSVYCHLALNAVSLASSIATVRKNKPKKGVVQVLTVTEKQFARMEFIIGEYNGDILNSDERLVIL